MSQKKDWIIEIISALFISVVCVRCSDEAYGLRQVQVATRPVTRFDGVCRNDGVAGAGC